MLDEKRLQRNRKWLEDARVRFQTDLVRMESAGSQVDRPGLGTHMADQATEVFEQARDLAVSQRLSLTLGLIDKALTKMQDGNYGKCEVCGRDIDPARLKALPYAVLCMTCQAKSEKTGSPR
jgi:DnaK suppressor protein